VQAEQTRRRGDLELEHDFWVLHPSRQLAKELEADVPEELGPSKDAPSYDRGGEPPAWRAQRADGPRRPLGALSEANELAVLSRLGPGDSNLVPH
jgi:hypothetical protein